MKFSKREMALLGLLLVLGGVYLTSNYLFQPLQTQKQQLVSENNKLGMEIQVLQNEISRYQSMEQAGLQIGDNYQKMLEAVPQSPLIPSIINYLELKARDTKVKLISIRYKENALGDTAPNSVKSALNIKPVNFQIVASGSHFDLLSFILEIENAPRIYIINSGKISLCRTDQSPVGIAASVNSADVTINDKVMDKTVPESITYDQSKSLLDLNFSAYYHGSLLNEDV